MTKWRETTLGEVVELKRGYDLPATQREAGKVPIVSSSGVTGYHSVAKVSGPGVVTGRYGTLGEVFFIEEDFWPLNTALYVRNFKGNEPRFIAALLQSLQLGRNAGAAAVPGVNRNQLHGLLVKCPDIDTQRRIAAVLGALDSLIENNRLRIELLERMAQGIYREWFVRFRYPGHEQVPLIDSELGRVPKGWLALTWGDLARLDYGRALSDYKNAKAEYPVFGTNGPIGWHSTPLFPPGVIVGRKGAYRGIHFSEQSCWVIDTAFYLNIRDTKQIDPLFAFYQLRMVDLNSIDSGSAIPSTSRDAFYAIPAVVPPIELVERFSHIARDMFDMQRTLEGSSGVLRASRDLLLSPLISGQIDVSRLNLPVGILRHESSTIH